MSFLSFLLLRDIHKNYNPNLHPEEQLQSIQDSSRCQLQREGFACLRIIGCTVVQPCKPMAYGRVQLVMTLMHPTKMTQNQPIKCLQTLSQWVRMLTRVFRASLPLRE